MVEWERYKKEGDHENLRMTTGKYFRDHSRHIFELIDKPNKKTNRIFIDNEVATAAHEFRKKLDLIDLMLS